jgi:hypothetical protein
MATNKFPFLPHLDREEVALSNSFSASNNAPASSEASMFSAALMDSPVKK